MVFPYSILTIFFHSILKFSSIFHSILPYQGKFRPEAMRNLYCAFATLRILLQVVACKGKQHGLMHLIPYLKHYHNELQSNFDSMPPRYYTTFDRHQLNSIENIFTMPPLTLATMPHEVQYCSVLTKQ